MGRTRMLLRVVLVLSCALCAPITDAAEGPFAAERAKLVDDVKVLATDTSG